ncbi:uncharacterized protein PSFLO_02640 [Pseudozyma flocculosa]|uniref:Uncharacterized protein n=1 Tax=Pseudozyma flocculosa TaxID=84751 RepID=A0A5C3EY64_9BASI|nr:uncharacterized protein PSFLO_02640 [Pseudozyma flocculosa]
MGVRVAAKGEVRANKVGMATAARSPLEVLQTRVQGAQPASEWPRQVRDPAGSEPIRGAKAGRCAPTRLHQIIPASALSGTPRRLGPIRSRQAVLVQGRVRTDASGRIHQQARIVAVIFEAAQWEPKASWKGRCTAASVSLPACVRQSAPQSQQHAEQHVLGTETGADFISIRFSSMTSDKHDLTEGSPVLLHGAPFVCGRAPRTSRTSRTSRTPTLVAAPSPQAILAGHIKISKRSIAIVLESAIRPCPG